jgi:hypothetical protein
MWGSGDLRGNKLRVQDVWSFVYMTGPSNATIFGGQTYFKDEVAAVKPNSTSLLRNHLGFSTLQLSQILDRYSTIQIKHI